MRKFYSLISLLFFSPIVFAMDTSYSITTSSNNEKKENRIITYSGKVNFHKKEIARKKIRYDCGK